MLMILKVFLFLEMLFYVKVFILALIYNDLICLKRDANIVNQLVQLTNQAFEV